MTKLFPKRKHTYKDYKGNYNSNKYSLKGRDNFQVQIKAINFI